jgi:myo-inositol-1(or 4)-monophosphatase
MDKKLLATAIKAGKAATEILRRGFGKEIETISKNSEVTGDLVTKYDYAAQKAILKIITKQFPDHSLLAEEGISVATKSPYQWVIDPLDGTSNFSRAIPHFGTSIGLAYKGKLVAGVVGMPATNEFFYASLGHGTFRNNKKIKVSQTDNIHRATIGIAMIRSASGLKTATKTFQAVINAPAKPRMFASAAADLARVAMGSLDGVIFNNLNPWDIAAGLILVTEAGGKVSSPDGKPFSLYANQMVASNKILHKKMVGLVS